jgi:hypothetical protein
MSRNKTIEDLLLLQIEESTMLVRDHVKSLQEEWIPKEYQSQLDRCHRLESCFCSSNGDIPSDCHVSLLGFFKSLTTAIGLQRAMTTKSLRIIQDCLDESCCYIDPTSSFLLDSVKISTLQRESYWLQQRCIRSTKPPWSTASALLQPVSSSYHNTSINALSLVDTVNELLFQWDWEL